MEFSVKIDDALWKAIREDDAFNDDCEALAALIASALSGISPSVETTRRILKVGKVTVQRDQPPASWLD